MEIKLKSGKHAPELAVCWYVGQMLATQDFLVKFVNQYCEDKEGEIKIENAEIVRENNFRGKRIDLCIYITDSNRKKYGFVIEAKVHWPDAKQLEESVSIFKEHNSEYKTIGLHFLTTIDEKQLSALPKDNQLGNHRKIIRIKEFIRDYCCLGIENGYSFKLASDLHQLLNYEKT